MKITRGDHKGIEIKQAAVDQNVNIQLDFILSLEKENGDTDIIGDTDIGQGEERPALHSGRRRRQLVIGADDNDARGRRCDRGIAQHIPESHRPCWSRQGWWRVHYRGKCRLGAPYEQVDTWVGFHITQGCPYADVYPHFVRPDLSRVDNKPLGEVDQTGHVFPQPGVVQDDTNEEPRGRSDLAAFEQARSQFRTGNPSHQAPEGAAMAEVPLDGRSWHLIMPEGLYAKLHAHLFPGDGEEHGAVIEAGIATDVRQAYPLFGPLPSSRDRTAWTTCRASAAIACSAPDFVRDRIRECRDERLIYLAVHNHGRGDSVGFSGDDLDSHERGYPALLDIADGMPVGALVFASHAIAGDIWLPDGGRVELADAVIVGRRRGSVVPRTAVGSSIADKTYDRQVRLFGDAGQDILRRTRVAIIGLGGVGSLLAEYLAHLGVGHFVLIDPTGLRARTCPRRWRYPIDARSGSPGRLGHNGFSGSLQDRPAESQDCSTADPPH